MKIVHHIIYLVFLKILKSSLFFIPHYSNIIIQSQLENEKFSCKVLSLLIYFKVKVIYNLDFLYITYTIDVNIT